MAAQSAMTSPASVTRARRPPTPRAPPAAASSSVSDGTPRPAGGSGIGHVGLLLDDVVGHEVRPLSSSRLSRSIVDSTNLPTPLSHDDRFRA